MKGEKQYHSHMKHGCPPQAIVATYGYDERTVYGWHARGGEHCQQVHEAIVEQGQIDIQHVQADELCVNTVKLRKDEIQNKEQTEQDGPLSTPEEPTTVAQALDEEIHSHEEESPVHSEQGKKEANHMWMAVAMDVGTRLWLGGCVKINTSFIERLNATFRGRLVALVRKGRAIAHTDSKVLPKPKTKIVHG